MGTRADFYVGRGEKARWVGSIAWDGYPLGIAPNESDGWPNGQHLFDAKTEDEFLARINKFFDGREDVKLPKDGWPWPWDNSNTTDYAYAFDGGLVYGTCFGCGWWLAHYEPEDHNQPNDIVWPPRPPANVQLFGNKSGLIIIG